MEKTIKPWRCGHGHVLGWVRRNGSGIRQMLLLRHALDMGIPVIDENDPGPMEPDVMAVIDGLVLDVRCDLCGGMRTWVPGQAKKKT